MQKFLFRQVELWVVCLILLLGLLSTVAFGWLALSYGRDPHPKGALAEATLAVAGIPDTMKARNLTREQVIKDVLLAGQPTKRFSHVEDIGAMAVQLGRDGLPDPR